MPRDPIEPGGTILSNEVAFSVCIERGVFDVTQNCIFYDSGENQLTTTSAESPFTAKLTFNSFPQTVVIEYQGERMSYTFNNGGVGYLIRFYGVDISEIETPDRVSHKIKDSRIPGVDNTPTSGSENVVTSGGVYTAIESVAQIQSDWNQTTTTANDYIKNKPNVVNNGNGVVGINNSTFGPGLVNIGDGKNSISLNNASDDGILITTNSGSDGRISLTASSNIELNTSGTNKAYYNNEEIATKGDIKPALPIPFGAVDSSSTATVITATVNNFPNTLTDGVCAYIRNDVITSASGWTLNINGTGALPVYSSNADATRTTTVFAATTTYLFVYNSSRVSGGCWDIYYGYDSNTNTIGYQIRTNSYSLPMKSIVYRYRLLFTSADGKHFVPANYSSSTNATTARTVCQDPIDPFGAIVYYGTTASVAANARPNAANLWSQYAITLGYSFNRTGAALTLTPWEPVYIKCGPQDDGSAIIDLYTPYVQALPTSEDGKIYIFLGVAYNATSIELNINHPVYCYKEGAIRPWVNATDAALSSSDIRGIWSDVFGAVLISFTINGTTYQAEEGMTWREWTESEYNTGGYECSGQNVTAPAYGAPYVHDVNATDVIVDGRAYTHDTVGGGSND